MQASEEPWFEIPYVAAPIPAELLEAWGSAGGSSGELALPQRNEYIATDFSLREAPEEAKSVPRAVSRTIPRTTSSRSANGSMQVRACATHPNRTPGQSCWAGVRATVEGVASAHSALPMAPLRCSRFALMCRFYKPQLLKVPVSACGGPGTLQRPDMGRHALRMDDCFPAEDSMPTDLYTMPPGLHVQTDVCGATAGGAVGAAGGRSGPATAAQTWTVVMFISTNV